MHVARPFLVALLAPVLFAACGKDASSPAPAAPSASAPAAPGAPKTIGATSAYALAAEPAGAIAVVDAKAKGAAKEVVVVGRLKDTVPGFAAFTLTDASLKFCSDDDKCPTPWDYCCIAADKVDAATIPVAVRVKGETVAAPVPELRNLDLVVVHGALVKAEDGTLRLEADGWFRKERPTVAAHVVFPK